MQFPQTYESYPDTHVSKRPDCNAIFKEDIAYTFLSVPFYTESKKPWETENSGVNLLLDG